MSSKYAITTGDELYHWKYIKREKQANGKYKYYYNADQLKSDIKNATVATAKANYQKTANASLSWQKQARNAALKNVTTNVADKDPATKYGSSYKRIVDQSKKHDLQDKTEKAESKYRTTTVGKIDQAVDNASYNVKKKVDSVKNWVKDKVGYDEKENAKNAETKAKVKQHESQDAHERNKKWLQKYYTHDPETGALIKKSGYDNVHYLAEWDNKYHDDIAQEARDEALIAKFKYEKTPLAALEKISGRVDKLAERGKERIKLGLGYYDKIAYERAQKEVEYREKEVKELEETIKKLPPRDKVISPEYLDYMDSLPGDLNNAKSKLDSAKRDLKQQEKDYMDTPLNKISENERLYEFVDEWLNGTSKKRKKR